jgi:hydroxymethylglutaryl-CoA synthase
MNGSSPARVPIGLDKIGVYPGSLVLSMQELCEARGQDQPGFLERMLVQERSLNPVWEDPVTMAVNAADRMLTEEERASIELLIVATESSVDQEKAISTWVQRYLRLGPNCRNFELKHACYGGTGALQMALSWIASGLAGDARALVISTDQSRMHLEKSHEYVTGAAASAVLVSRHPRLLEIELGQNGYWTNEVWDLTRPTLTFETGDPELSMLTYLDALEGAYAHYEQRCGTPPDFDTHFARHVYHSPFGGMTFLAHKTLMSAVLGMAPKDVPEHFARKTLPSLGNIRRIGSTYGSSTFVALVTLLADDEALAPGDRVSVFGFGSGACAEFYTGLVASQARDTARAAGLRQLLDGRHSVSVAEYEAIERRRSSLVEVPTYDTDRREPSGAYGRLFAGQRRLVFEGLTDHVRRYAWS